MGDVASKPPDSPTKAVVTAAGAGVLAAEAFWGPDTTIGKVLVIASAALAVYLTWRIPNRRRDGSGSPASQPSPGSPS